MNGRFVVLFDLVAVFLDSPSGVKRFVLEMQGEEGVAVVDLGSSL